MKKINDYRPKNIDGLKEKLSKSYAVAESGCHVYTGSKTHNGYGRLAFRFKHYRAHRVSFELNFGPIPHGHQVCHKCDNPPCINPDHLFLGTAKDNALDRKIKGRGNNQYTKGRPR
jgi:hypothetical protein